MNTITSSMLASTNNHKRRRAQAGKPAIKRQTEAIGLVFDTNRAAIRAHRRANRLPTKPGRPNNQRTDRMFNSLDGLPFLHRFWDRAGIHIA